MRRCGSRRRTRRKRRLSLRIACVFVVMRQRRWGRGSSARSEASAESVCQVAATEQKTVDNQFGKRLIPNSYDIVERLATWFEFHQDIYVAIAILLPTDKGAK
jgi:transcription initiation factor TFIIIB Brf1 subunit/transcription initiation factor TFIIB